MTTKSDVRNYHNDVLDCSFNPISPVSKMHPLHPSTGTWTQTSLNIIALARHKKNTSNDDHGKILQRTKRIQLTHLNPQFKSHQTHKIWPVSAVPPQERKGTLRHSSSPLQSTEEDRMRINLQEYIVTNQHNCQTIWRPNDNSFARRSATSENSNKKQRTLVSMQTPPSPHHARRCACAQHQRNCNTNNPQRDPQHIEHHIEMCKPCPRHTTPKVPERREILDIHHPGTKFVSG